MPKSVFTTANKAVIAVLVETRKATGVRQEELGKRLGKPQSFVSRIEGGQRRVDVIEFYAIAMVLGVDPAALYSQVAQQLPKQVDI